MKKVKEIGMEFYRKMFLAKQNKFVSSSKEQSKYHTHMIILIGVLVLSAFFLPNCAGRLDPIKKYSIGCDVSLGRYGTIPQDVNLTLRDKEGNIVASGKGFKIINADYNSLGKETNKLYLDSEYEINDYKEMKETAHIQFNSKDANLNVEKYMELELNKDIEALYIAYDSRFQTDWILNTNNYKLLVKKDGDALSIHKYIETTIEDKNKPAEFVKFNLYERLNFSKQGDKLALPGNSYQVKSLLKDQVKVPNPAMYTLLIKPKVDIDYNSPRNLKVLPTEVCINYDENLKPNYALAKKAAIADCENKYLKKAGYFCTIKSKCDTAILTEECPRPNVIIGKYDFPLTYSFTRHSEIALDKTKSIANIKINGKTYIRNVSGHIHFQYLLDDKNRMLTMQVNSLKIEADPFEKFSDIRFALFKPVKAYCKDTYPPWATPCQNYQIRKGEFLCNESCLRDGKPIAFALSNINPIDINITEIGPTRSFRMKGGPLYKNLKVGKRKFLIEISIDLTGTFTNFAPFAEIGKEFKRFSECTGGDCPEGSNLDPIILDADGSFDIDDGTIPPGNYAWYENYGLSTEKLWGKGERITIPPCQMSFGVHYMTLEVRDSADVPSTAEFKVRVIDTKPPLFTSLPGDRFYLATRPGKVKIDIGKATARDNCQNNVMIRNNASDSFDVISNSAPDSFEAGMVTPVVWTADDGFGNDTKVVQNVYVFLVKNGILDKLSLERIIKNLDKMIESSQNNIAHCTKGSVCHKTLENLEVFLVDLAKPKMGKIEKPTKSDLHKQSTVESLRNAQELLHEALNALDSKNAREAYEKLEDVRNYLKEVVGDR